MKRTCRYLSSPANNRQPYNRGDTFDIVFHAAGYPPPRLGGTPRRRWIVPTPRGFREARRRCLSPCLLRRGATFRERIRRSARETGQGRGRSPASRLTIHIRERTNERRRKRERETRYTYTVIERYVAS